MRLFWIFFFLPLSTLAQKSSNAFFELGGSGGLGSFNYEKCFFVEGNLDFTFRSGISFAPIDHNNGFGIILPILVNAQIGKGANKLEIGMGEGFTVTTKGSFFVLMPVVLGWRYQREGKRVFYRVTYTPLISYLIDFQYQHWGGLSIGYTFKEKTK